MILMHGYCPGPGWQRLEVAFIVCEKSGQVIVPRAGESFWFRGVIA
jgi:hypothetical protein